MGILVMVTLALCSPHERGWSPVHGFEACLAALFPICAGDGPEVDAVRARYGLSSPHARGWSPDRLGL
ncbi:hypothetical protein SAMN05216483_4108 [Streptomyces sp. 2131.1]|nr:hypothetical protein SAMN05216483_4108 [Streptomyces sp. 2131.1]